MSGQGWPRDTKERVDPSEPLSEGLTPYQDTGGHSLTRQYVSWRCWSWSLDANTAVNLVKQSWA